MIAQLYFLVCPSSKATISFLSLHTVGRLAVSPCRLGLHGRAHRYLADPLIPASDVLLLADVVYDLPTGTVWITVPRW